MYVGAGSAPMSVSGLRHRTCPAADLQSAGSSFSSVTSGLAGSSWQGPASAAMAEASRPVCSTWLGVISAAPGHPRRPGHARTAAGAFEAAVAATVHPTIAGGQPRSAGVAGDLEHLRAPTLGDRGRRGSTTSRVGPGRCRDGRLPCRRVGGGRGVDAVSPSGSKNLSRP